MQVSNRSKYRGLLASCYRAVSVIALLLLLPAHSLLASSFGQNELVYESLLADEQTTLEEIIAQPQDRWNLLSDNIHTANLIDTEQAGGTRGSALWIKVKLPRRPAEKTMWIEFSPNVGLDGRIAQFVDGRWKWFLPAGLDTREQTRHPVNFLTFELFTDGEKKIAYLKLNTSLAYHFKVNTIDKNELLWQAVGGNLFNGFLLGFLCLAIIYNLAIGISAGEKVYLYYSFYVFCNAIYIGIVSGYLRLIFPEWGGLGNMGNLGASLVLFSGVVFVREFLDTKVYAPKTDATLQFLQAMIFASLLFISFISDFAALAIVLTLGTLAPATVLTAGYVAYRARHPYAGFFLVAYSLFIASIFIWVGMWLGIFKPTLFVTQVFKVGSMVEITILSLVLAYRYSYLKEQTEQLDKAKTAFKQLSETDDLTGVLNRRGFLRQAQEIIMSRDVPRVWLAMDIDHFKQFNDLNGHIAGDHLLSEFGNILDSNRRREDLAAKLIADTSQKHYRRAVSGRIGGEEFAVLITDCTLGQAKLYAERLIEEFQALRVDNLHGQRVGSTLSIGATALTPEDSLEDVWKRADRLLYDAKNAGRNQVVTD